MAELRGRPLSELLTGAAWETVQKNRQALLDGSTIDLEGHLTTASGRTVWTSAHANLFRNDAGKPEYIMVQVLDHSATHDAQSESQPLGSPSVPHAGYLHRPDHQHRSQRSHHLRQCHRHGYPCRRQISGRQEHSRLHRRRRAQRPSSPPSRNVRQMPAAQPNSPSSSCIPGGRKQRAPKGALRLRHHDGHGRSGKRHCPGTERHARADGFTGTAAQLGGPLLTDLPLESRMRF